MCDLGLPCGDPRCEVYACYLPSDKTVLAHITVRPRSTPMEPRIGRVVIEPEPLAKQVFVAGFMASWRDAVHTQTRREYVQHLAEKAWTKYKLDNFRPNRGDTPMDNTEAEKRCEAIADRSASEIVSRTEHLFAGAPDARQGGADVKPSRFRPTYRALTPGEVALQNSIKIKAGELEELIEKSRSGRYQSLAMTALEEAVMWAVKGITQ